MLSEAVKDELDTALEKKGFAADYSLSKSQGGANSLCATLEIADERFFLKVYATEDSSDNQRFERERKFYTFLAGHNISQVPELIANGNKTSWILLTAHQGKKISAGDKNAPLVPKLVDFVESLNSVDIDSVSLPDASEACFSLDAHLQMMENRLEGFAQVPFEGELGHRAEEFLREQVEPFWNVLKVSLVEIASNNGLGMREEVPRSDRIVSPSDFGFHNCLLQDSGDLLFYDFEHAGWDDPAKCICDLFWQPQVPIDHRHRNVVEQLMLAAKLLNQNTLKRSRLLFPLYGLKWCFIVLNHFKKDALARRIFSEQTSDIELEQKIQLEKANQILQSAGTTFTSLLHCNDLMSEGAL